MKVLIIGSKGFIGHHLFNYFCERGFQVWDADVVFDYTNSKRYFLILDSENSDFSSVFQNESYDLCVNCSGAASVYDSIKNSKKSYYLNTVNVYNILDAIKKFQPNCKFINLSSAAVYGNPQHLPVSENESIHPLSPYGVHKYLAEQICKEFYDYEGIKTCSLRIFSVYGVGLNKQLYWDLYKKTKTNKHIVLYGTGYESRDFINIFDLVRAIEIISECSNFEADVINVANGEEISIKDAVKIFYSFFEDEISYSFSGEARKGDPINWRADITKLNSYGYKPTIDLDTGLKEYYDWVVKLKN